VLLAGVGPQGDPAQAVGLARALRDAGGEVVHLGEVPTADVVAAVARDEDAHVVVVLPAGAADPGSLVEAVRSALLTVALDDVVVVDGGSGDVAAAVAAVASAAGS